MFRVRFSMAQKRPKTVSINIVEKQSNYEPTGDAKQTKDALPRSEWKRIPHIRPCYKCCARLGSEKNAAILRCQYSQSETQKGTSKFPQEALARERLLQSRDKIKNPNLLTNTSCQAPNRTDKNDLAM